MKAKKIRFLTWNLENLFHPDSGGPRRDHTPEQGWTHDRYERKLQRLASIFSQVSNNYTQKQDTALVWGLTEIENVTVCEELLEKIGRKSWKIARPDSFSYSYCDTMIVYDENFLELEFCHYVPLFKRFEKGDVCHARFALKDSYIVFDVFCCHLKARPHDEHHTQMYRQAVCDNLQNLIWRLHEGDKLEEQRKEEEKTRPCSFDGYKIYPHIILMGDFNDEPFSSSLMKYLKATYDKKQVLSQHDEDCIVLYNASWEKLMSERPGSLYYEHGVHSSWNMLDQMILSPSLLSPEYKKELLYKKGSFEVLQNLTSNEQGKPFRTSYRDDEGHLVWQEGYSDHFPTTLELEVL